MILTFIAFSYHIKSDRSEALCSFIPKSAANLSVYISMAEKYKGRYCCLIGRFFH